MRDADFVGHVMLITSQIIIKCLVLRLPPPLAARTLRYLSNPPTTGSLASYRPVTSVPSEDLDNV